MTERRGSRFLFEVLFLVALATALTLAHLDALEIGLVMLVGWVIVAALEWAAWRGEPHYGSGLPPRYYVPSVNLPPAQPLEQVAAGYPDATRDEAPTWIAPASLRAEMLGEWPVAAPVVDDAADEEEADAFVPDEAPDADPWQVAELPAEPLEAPAPPLAVSQPKPPVVALAEPEPEPQPASVATAPEPEPEPEPTIDTVLARSVQGVARYSLDPLADPPAKKRFGRGGGDEAAAVEVPARPERVRALPGRSTRQD
jgi:hypothetical protein